MQNVIAYHDIVARLASLTDAPSSLLQVHAGMAIYLGCLLLMGTRRGSLAAVLVVVALAVFHETMNRLLIGGWNWHQTVSALVLTLFWPTMCYAVSWYRRWSWAERERHRSGDRLLHLYDYRPEGAVAPARRAAQPPATGSGSR